MLQEIKMEILLYILKFNYAFKILIDCMCVVGMCTCVFRWLWGHVFLGCAYMYVHMETKGKFQRSFPKCYLHFFSLFLGRDAHWSENDHVG